MTSARAAAFRAVYAYLKTGAYIDETLSLYPSTESALARHIAYGTTQRLLSLDYLARQLTPHAQKALALKVKEKAILFTALYQAHFLHGAPLYAITSEMVELAKQECSSHFVRFLNALLRSYGTRPPQLPQGTDSKSLSIHYSYPQPLVEELLRDYTQEETERILAQGNEPAPTMARRRSSPCTVIPIDNPTSIASSSEYYIQNRTPVHLMEHLAAHTPTPATILDLCAAPGGKLILAHDLYPKAQLAANDISAERLSLLRDNLHKYQISASLSCGPAEQYQSPSLFDLILLDVPCSNTGVLGKRPEARWRIDNNYLKELRELQLALLTKAQTLLSPQGCIWYMTCSILKRENEELTQSATQTLSLIKQQEVLQLPTADGWDGGYACILSHSLSEFSQGKMTQRSQRRKESVYR